MGITSLKYTTTSLYDQVSTHLKSKSICTLVKDLGKYTGHEIVGEYAS